MDSYLTMARFTLFATIHVQHPIKTSLTMIQCGLSNTRRWSGLLFQQHLLFQLGLVGIVSLHAQRMEYRQGLFEFSRIDQPVCHSQVMVCLVFGQSHRHGHGCQFTRQCGTRILATRNEFGRGGWSPFHVPVALFHFRPLPLLLQSGSTQHHVATWSMAGIGIGFLFNIALDYYRGYSHTSWWGRIDLFGNGLY